MLKLIGSRYNLVNDIYRTIKDFTGIVSGEENNWCIYDVCAGTGSISFEFLQRGFKNIFLNDLCYYCYVYCSSVFEMGWETGLQKLYNFLMEKNSSYVCPFEERIDLIHTYLNSLEGYEGFITKNYTRLFSDKTNFYSVDNGKRIDAIRIMIEKWDAAGLLTQVEKRFLVGSLLISANGIANIKYRYDSALKTSHPEVMKLFSPNCVLRTYKDLRPRFDRHCVTNFDIEYTKLDCQYNGITIIDPSFQRHDYTYQYGLPITIAKYDNPPLRGTYNFRPQEPSSNFCSKERYMTALRSAVNNCMTRFIVIIVPSYDNKATFDNDKIEQYVKGFGFKRIQITRVTGKSDLLTPWRALFPHGKFVNLYCIERNN